MTAGVILRDATPDDVPEVLRLLRALAAYERKLDRCVVQEADLQRVLFGPRPYAQALLAEVDGRSVGMVLWHTTVSTFTGRPGYWVEDIFVEDHARGRGIGRAMFVELGRRLKAENGRMIHWRVLRWNAPAIAFYRGLGAEGDPGEWEEMRLSGDALACLTT